MTIELATLIQRHARYRPDVTAVVCGDQRLTYAQFRNGGRYALMPQFDAHAMIEAIARERKI